MVKHVGSCLVLVLALTGLAHGAGRHERWKTVEQLAQGKPVEVQLRGLAGVEGCRLVSVDDSALTCVREQDPDANWDAASGARLVFPRAAVADVWLMETGERHLARWIVAVATLVFVIAACAVGDVVTGLFLAGIVVVGWAVADIIAIPRPQSQGQWTRRSLIYRSATP